jgi:nucleoside-diphosphate-sugar epimerase
MRRSASNVRPPRKAPVLVTGAGGFLGLGIVRAGAARGQEARGLVRDAAKANRVRLVGGRPVIADVLDPDSVRRAVRGCAAIIHVAANPSDGDDDPDLARRVRVEGTHNLAEAARAAHVRRLVVGSGYWVYPGRPGVTSEESPVDPQGEAHINYDAEQAGLSANSPGALEVMVVRPGMVYGDGAWFRPVLDSIRAETYRLIDGGSNFWSFVALPDAGAGFLSVAEAGQSGGTYNLTDDHPARWGDFARFVADRIGRRPPGVLSSDEAVQEYGPVIARHLAANRAASAAKLTALGWRPKYPNFPEGIDALLAEMGLRTPARSGRNRPVPG